MDSKHRNNQDRHNNGDNEEAVQDRLDKLEAKIANKKRRGTRLCWIRWDENSKYGYEIDSAAEDVAWLIHEVRRLRGENRELHAFAREFRHSLDIEFERGSGNAGNLENPQGFEAE